jgi:predicted CoA-binding protein
VRTTTTPQPEHTVHKNPSDDALRDLLARSRTIAVVGASPKPERPSLHVIEQLLDAGYHVIPVNPNETLVLGQRSYPSLADVPEPVDIVDVFRPASETPAIADEAVRIGAKALWLQLGIWNNEAAARAAAAGLTVVMNRCIGATVGILGVHAAPPLDETSESPATGP